MIRRMTGIERAKRIDAVAGGKDAIRVVES